MNSAMLKKLAAAFGLVMVCVSAWALTDKQIAQIESRIQPAGKVCLQGDNMCGAAVVASLGGAPKSGEEIYKSSCQGCHASGAGNAPVFGDVVDWGKRAEQGADTLYRHAIEGYNNIGMMPAKGLCMSCSDNDIIIAVDYILANSQ